MTIEKALEFEEELRSYLECAFRMHGLDSLSVKLISILYFEPDEIPMDDLAEKTGYSLSAVSTKLKQWENFRLIEKRKNPGSKKIYYYMEKDLKTINIKKIKAALEQMDNITKQMPEVVKKYKSEAEKSKNKRFKKQIEIAENYSVQVKKLEKIFLKTIDELEKM